MDVAGSFVFIVFTLIEIHKQSKIRKKKICSKMPSELLSDKMNKNSFSSVSENQDERMSNL